MIMINTPHNLDIALDRQHTIPDAISADGPLPSDNHAYENTINRYWITTLLDSALDVGASF